MHAPVFRKHIVTANPDRRTELTDRMADFVLANGLAAASLRPLAAAAGVSDRMLLYYFKDKSLALTAAFECILQRLTAALAARVEPRALPIGRLRGKVVPILLSKGFWPYMQLWLEITALAARGDEVQRSRGRAIWTLCEDWIKAQLESQGPHDSTRMMQIIHAAIQQKAIGPRDAAG